jgi:hypothetical protein
MPWLHYAVLDVFKFRKIQYVLVRTLRMYYIYGNRVNYVLIYTYILYIPTVRNLTIHEKCKSLLFWKQISEYIIGTISYSLNTSILRICTNFRIP